MTAVVQVRYRGRDLIDPDLFERLSTRVAADHADVDPKLAERILDQALAFLAACAANPGTGLSPSRLVDLGWHALILSTRDYAALCDRLAGGFIHHLPDNSSGESAATRSVGRTLEAITAAGYAIDDELWPLRAKCGQCHEDGNCSNSGKDGNENSDDRRKGPK